MTKFGKGTLTTVMCVFLLCVLLVIGVLSCASDPEKSSGGGGSGKSDASAWFDAGEDCENIEPTTQYAPQDEDELKALIQRDRVDQGETVNLNYLDTSGITTMAGLFANTKSGTEGATFNGVLNCWDVSSVTDMSRMFKGASKFGQNISTWTVSNVTNMAGMFQDAEAFNRNLSTWSVGSVMDMENMFNGASQFNQDISNWDMGEVENMNSMFKGASAFNKDLSNWSQTLQASVSTESMFIDSGVTTLPDWKNAGVCFHSTNGENIVANKGELQTKISALITADNPSPNLNHIETCNVTDMSLLFKDKSTFNGDITGWDVRKVINMENMFQGASVFNQDIGGWDVSEVKNMSLMFASATVFDQDIGKWNVGKVESMYGMFASATAFDQDIGKWNVGKVESMYGMFQKASAFNQDIGNWNVANVIQMVYMFNRATAFNKPIANWNVTKKTAMQFMFWEASAFCQNLNGWEIKISQDKTGNMFTSAGPASCTIVPPNWWIP